MQRVTSLQCVLEIQKYRLHVGDTLYKSVRDKKRASYTDTKNNMKRLANNESVKRRRMNHHHTNAADNTQKAVNDMKVSNISLQNKRY